jgi:hypothetical protein
VADLTPKDALDSIDKIVEKAESSGDFTSDEIQTLKKVAEVWKGFEVFGKVAGLVKAILVYLGWFVGLYLGFKYVFLDWLRALK